MKTYGEERSFLESCGVRVVELSDESGRARVCLVPAWQGRVMTSTAAGTGGPGYGWINRSLIASGVRKSQFNPFGGEERLWLGREAGSGGAGHRAFPGGRAQCPAGALRG